MGYNQNNVLVGVGELKVDGSGIGFTSGGLMLQHATEKMEKEVDQSYAPVGIHKIKETFALVTNLAEASLANLKMAWDQTQSIVTTSTKRTLSWGMNPNVVEHTLQFIGISPEGLARTYTVRKAVIWETGDMNHSKDGITLIPITFRILPDTAMSAGLEYGSIEDTIA